MATPSQTSLESKDSIPAPHNGALTPLFATADDAILTRQALDGDPRFLAAARGIDRMCWQHVAKMRKKGGSLAAIEAIQAWGDEQKDQIKRLALDGIKPMPTTIRELFRPEHVGVVVALTVSITRLAQPCQLEFEDSSSTTLIDLVGGDGEAVTGSRIVTLQSTMEVSDLAATTIATAPFEDRGLIERIQRDGSKYAQWRLIGLVLTQPSGIQTIQRRGSDDIEAQAAEYVLLPLDAEPMRTAIQSVEPTPGELEAAERMYAQDLSPLATGIRLIERALGIQGLGDNPLLREALEVQVLAAASEGRRIHSIVVGPPAMGKSLVHRAAALLQPISRSVMPTKITEAGLIGSGSSLTQRRRPGLLPQAHTGVFSLEDFNQANNSKNQRCVAAFTNSMQDGKVVDASASMVEYEAQISVLLDANRRSDVRRTDSSTDGLQRFVQDTGIPTNILSRATYVTEWTRNPITQIRTARAMLMTKGMPHAEENVEVFRELRWFQVYLALMRHRHSRVEIPESVREAASQRFMELVNVPHALFEQHPDLGDFLTRAAEHMDTFIQAHARLHDRSIATEADLDGIIGYLWRKYEFIKGLIIGDTISSDVVNAGAAARRRVLHIQLMAQGRTSVTAAQARKWTGQTSVTPATTADDLQALYGAPDQQGFYSVVVRQAGHAA